MIKINVIKLFVYLENYFYFCAFQNQYKNNSVLTQNYFPIRVSEKENNSKYI